MSTNTLIGKLTFELSKEVILKIEAKSSLSSKLKILREWIHSKDDINHEQRLDWHSQILLIANQQKELPSQAESLTCIAKINDRLGKFDDSLYSIRKAQKIFIKLLKKDNSYTNSLIISYCDEAVVLRLQNRLEEALSTLHKGYQLFKKNGPSSELTQIILFSDLGTIYKNLTDYPAALNAFHESLSIIKKSKNKKKIFQNEILSHINIGNVLKESEKYEDAIKEYNNSIHLLKKNSKYSQYYIITNINLGQTLVESKKLKEALQAYENALEKCKKSGGNLDLGFIYLLIAEVYFKLKDIKKFDSYIKKGKKLVRDGCYPPDLLFLNHLTAQKNVTEKKYNKAISILKKSIDICINNNMDKHLLRSYKEISLIYKNSNETSKALEYSEKYIKHRNISDKKSHQIFLNEKQQSLNRMKQEIETMREEEKKNLIALELRYKKRELISKKLHSLSNRDFIEKLYKNLKLKSDSVILNNVLESCKNQLLQTSSWNDFLTTYEQTDPDFMNEIMNISNILSPTEIRVCTLIRLGLDTFEMASFMSVSKRSIEQHRYRIKKKLKIKINLTEYILML